MILDKINQFSEGKYTLDVSAAQIAAEYEEKRGESAAVVEALSITQRFISTCKRDPSPLSNRGAAATSNPPPIYLSQTCRSAAIASWYASVRHPLGVDGINGHRRFANSLECHFQEVTPSPARPFRLRQELPIPLSHGIHHHRTTAPILIHPLGPRFRRCVVGCGSGSGEACPATPTASQAQARACGELRCCAV